MKFTRFTDARQFERRVKDYLLQHPAEHNLLLEILQTAVKNPQRYENHPYLATVEIEEKVIAVAFRVVPFELVLSKIDKLETIPLIAQDFYALNEKLPGVSGLVRESLVFVQTWQDLSRQSFQLNLQLKIHQLTRVKPIPQAKGYLRLATENDYSLLLQWLTAFEQEAWGKVKQNLEKVIKHYLNCQSIYIWQDEQPVSMATGSIVTQDFGRIGIVYTPLYYRRKGYASSCVAALSQYLIEQGCQYCFLFTDVVNLTSNHIYQIIGYQPVYDWPIYKFL